MKEEYESAKADLDKASMLERDNGAVRVASTRVQGKLSTIRFQEYREQGNALLKQKKFGEALSFYDKCLKITRQATTLDNVAVFVNKIACLLSMDKHSQVVVEANDALRLLKNYKNRNDGKHSPDE